MYTLPKFKDALPQIRAAYAAKSLQAQKQNMPTACMYTGPCAIGVILPQEFRIAFDRVEEDSTRIEKLFVEGAAATTENEQDWSELQNAHDEWALSYDDTRMRAEENFLRVLAGLEEIYGS